MKDIYKIMAKVFQVILGYVCYLKFDVGNVNSDINVSLNIFYFINLGSRKIN